MSIKILTLNTAMVPNYPVFREEPDKPKRARKLVDAILNEDYDIICLQEVFSEEIRDIFYSKLKTKYPFIIKKGGYDFLWVQDSGLFLASKYPLKHTFDAFSASVDTDQQSYKGCIFCSVDLTNAGYKGVQLFCYNTHLQSGISNDDIRLNQLRELRKYMINTLNSIPASIGNQNVAALLLGDLNIVADVKNNETKPKKEFYEYYKMLDLLSYPRDLLLRKNPEGAGFTYNGKINSLIKFINADDKDQQRLDYILALDTVPVYHDDWKKQMLRKVECLSCNVKRFLDADKKDLSDHFGLEAVIDL